MPDRAMPTDPKFWLDALQWLVTGALALFVWLRKPGEDAGAAVSALRSEQAQHNQAAAHRITTLEERIKHMPTTAELRALEGSVRKVETQNEGLAEGLSAVRASLGRIETYLLHKKD